MWVVDEVQRLGRPFYFSEDTYFNKYTLFVGTVNEIDGFGNPQQTGVNEAT